MPDDADVTRRAPYATNPSVGARGAKTRRKIMEASLVALDEHGYAATTVERITKKAGCSRVAFYQYFVDKDDVYRRLGGHLAKLLAEALAELGPITPDQAGLDNLVAYIERRAAIHADYGSMFRAFSATERSDQVFAGGASRIGQEQNAVFISKIAPTGIRPKQLEATVALLISSISRTFDVANNLTRVAPEHFPAERVHHALARVIHRTLFGPAFIDEHPLDWGPVPAIHIPPAAQDVFAKVTELEREAARPDRRALAGLLQVGTQVVVARGYQATRVEDLVTAADISHGAFYRYFQNKHEFVRTLAAKALSVISATFGEAPSAGPDRQALQKWLRRFQAVLQEHGAIIQVWNEAGRNDDVFRSDEPAFMDWGRRQMAHVIGRRGFGDPDMEALVMLNAVEVFGNGPKSSDQLEAMVRIIERGLLGAA